MNQAGSRRFGRMPGEKVDFWKKSMPYRLKKRDNCYNVLYTLFSTCKDEVCTMCFDDPIYLDRGSFEDLMVDTDQHRICWMYHDILSHPRIAWLFDKYAGKGTPIREAWTTMAWVAAGYQEDNSFLPFI